MRTASRASASAPLHTVDKLEFWTEDARFGLQIPASLVESILTHCRDAGEIETGGILIGKYTGRQDCAVVDQVTGPPEDSEATRTRFRRGTANLQRLLDRLWRRERRYYLGEWHFHPGAAPDPSGVDHRQLRSIARDPGYSCPEPILLIIGGNPSSDWAAAAFVFPEGDQPTRMQDEGLTRPNAPS